MTIRVIIADDHAVVREGLRRYLDQEEDILVVGEAADGEQLLDMIDSADAAEAIILLDVSMPRMGGIEATKAIRRRHPGAVIVMLSAFDDPEFVIASVRAGARGYILKSGDTEQVARATRLVAAGTTVIDPKLMPLLAGDIPTENTTARTSHLTPREADVLQLVAYGYTNRTIAERLRVSPETVKKHLEHVFEKLSVHDRTEAVAAAFRRGLVR